jgi:hypothetical protein
MQQEQFDTRRPTRALPKKARGDNASFVDNQHVIVAKKRWEVSKKKMARAVLIEHKQPAFVAPGRRVLCDQVFGQLVIVRRCVPLIARDLR